MLQPELIRLLTESGHLEKTVIEGIPTFDSLSRELGQSGVCSTGDNTPTPFTFTPQRIQLNKDHELFEVAYSTAAFPTGSYSFIQPLFHLSEKSLRKGPHFQRCRDYN